MKTYEQRTKELSDFLKKKMLENDVRQGYRVSQARFAQQMGIKPASMSQWVNQTRLPDTLNATLLAVSLGSVVYDIIGIDKGEQDARFLFIAELWPKLKEPARDELIKYMERHRQSELHADTA